MRFPTQPRVWPRSLGKMVIGVVVAISLGALAWRSMVARAVVPAPARLTIAMPVQVASAALYVAHERALFAKHGLITTLQPFLLGRQALQAVLDGKSDLAIVADTPFMLAVLRGEQVAALATVFESRRAMAIVARKDSGISDPAALGGKRIGTVVGTNAEYFLDTMLDVNGIDRKSVAIVSLKPDHLVTAMSNKLVDAVTVWNPDLARLQEKLGARGLTIYGEEFFVYRFLVVGKKSYIDSHPAQVSRLLATLGEANGVIREDPAGTHALLGQRLKMASALLTRSVNPIDFTLTLDQPLLLALSDQSRWAMDKQMVPPQRLPDYLDFLRTAPLTEIAPHANKTIR